MNKDEFNLLSLNSPDMDTCINRNPLTVSPNTTVQNTISLMNQVYYCESLRPDSDLDAIKIHPEQFSCALVVEDSQLIGIFTAWDVISLSATNADLSQLKIANVMKPPVITIGLSEANDILKVISLICQYQVNCLPVIGEGCQLVGLITSLSACHALQTNWLKKTNQRLQLSATKYQKMWKLLSQVDDDLEIKEKQHKVTKLDLTNVLLQKEMTERQRITEALQQSETLYRHLVENQTDVIVRTNLQGQLTFVNTSACQTFGRLPNELLGQSIYQFFHPDDLPMALENMRTLASPPYRLNVSEQRALTVHGIRWLQWNVTAITNELGEVVETQGVGRDVTERKHTEQKIREQAALLDITTDAILVQDLKGDILFWNRGAERLYGWQAHEVLGRNSQDLLFTEISPQLEIAFNTAIEHGKWEGELQKVTKMRRKITVESRWTIMRDEQGQVKSILTVDTDITEKKQLQTQFLRAQRLESLGTLASGIAHDLNNILTPILSSSQILNIQIPHLDERHKQILNIIENNSKRAADLVRQILTFARSSDGKRVAVQIEQLLLELAQTLKSTFPKDIRINNTLPPQSLWTVLADSTQIYQVFMNLCVNARDAMPRGGTLSISAENLFIDENFARINLDAQVGPYVVITISDTGTGISPVIVERIFEPFFTTKEQGKGTGLGLSTVIGIVKNHNGFVNVSSELGQGSHFQVYLPAVQDKIMHQIKNLELPHGNGELILVVDDETAILEITKTSLEDYNYRTLIASNGIEAVSLYANHKNEISLVVMDMMMPSMDGLTAIRILQTINPQVKIIGVTGVTNNNQFTKTNNVMVEDVMIEEFLHKPHTIHELLHTINKVLN